MSPDFDPDEWEFYEPELTEEELQELLKEEGGRPLAEILADLEKQA